MQITKPDKDIGARPPVASDMGFPNPILLLLPLIIVIMFLCGHFHR